MVWLTFVVSAAIIVVAATLLAKYGDVIAVRTRLGGMFIGAILLASATSLPELITAFNSLRQNVPNLTAGDLFGSSMFNMLLLAVLDIFNQKARILRKVAFTHALTAALATSLTGLVVFFILVDIPWQIGWIGVDSLIILLVYIGGIWLIQLQGQQSGAAVDLPVESGKPIKLWQALMGFGVAAVILILAVPYLVSSSAEIAHITGLGTGFVGVVFVASVTSLPELVAALAATRLGAFDLAVGNLFGSNVFNMFAIGLVDILYIHGRFLGVIDSTFALAGLLGLLLTNLALVGNLARLERRFLFVEIDALLLIVVYFAGLWLLYSRGMGI